MQGNRNDFDLKERLVDKSFDAYVLALETINRITVRYRMEAFCYLICNAWELLLKAKILATTGEEEDIYYSKAKGQPRRSLTLRDCLRRVFSNDKDPVRRNVERIEELRDKAVHLVIGQMPLDLMGLFQASVVNYHKHSHDWFGMSLAEREPVGMMSIVYDISPEATSLSDNRLRSELGPEAFEFITQYCASLRKEFDELQRPSAFSITIDYSAYIEKRPEEADVRLSSGPIDGQVTHIVEVAKDSSISHPLRQKELLEKVNALLSDLQINTHDIQCIDKVYDIQEKRTDFFYRGKVKGSPGQYSLTFADWIVRQYQSDNQFFTKTRQAVKDINKLKKT